MRYAVLCPFNFFRFGMSLKVWALSTLVIIPFNSGCSFMGIFFASLKKDGLKVRFIKPEAKVLLIKRRREVLFWRPQPLFKLVNFFGSSIWLILNFFHRCQQIGIFLIFRKLNLYNLKLQSLSHFSKPLVVLTFHIIDDQSHITNITNKFYNAIFASNRLVTPR